MKLSPCLFVDYLRGRPRSGYDGEQLRPMSGTGMKQKSKKKGRKSISSISPDPKQGWAHQDYDSDEML